MIPHNRLTLGREENDAATRVIASGQLAQGPEVEAFEEEFCRFLGVESGSAVAVSSGTAALFLALWVLDARGRKVGLPVYSCSSLRHAAAMAGAEEHLLDSRSDVPNVDLDEADVSDDVVIVPHMFGIPARLDQERPAWIVEDCAHALGARCGGVPAGLRGRVGIYSFYATKLMTSGGQGGMLVSQDEALVDAVRDYREFDCRRDDRTRFNFQMTDLQAALGREQLRKLPGFLARREEIFERYRAAGARLLDGGVEGGSSSAVRYRAVWETRHPEKVISLLERREVRAIVPIEPWELLGSGESFPNALSWTRRTVSLPIYPSMTEQEVDRIAEAVTEAASELGS